MLIVKIMMVIFITIFVSVINNNLILQFGYGATVVFPITFNNVYYYSNYNAYYNRAGTPCTYNDLTYAIGHCYVTITGISNDWGGYMFYLVIGD